MKPSSQRIPPSPVHLRRLGPRDWKIYREVRLGALKKCPDAFGSTLAEEETRPPDAWHARLGRSDAVTFVAEIPGRGVVGLVVGGAYDEEAGLYSMWVEPEWRGRGVGGRLVDAVIDWARRRKKGAIFLDVGDGNTAAIALYRSRGFEPTGKAGRLPAPREHITEHQLSLVLSGGTS